MVRIAGLRKAPAPHTESSDYTRLHGGNQHNLRKSVEEVVQPMVGQPVSATLYTFTQKMECEQWLAKTDLLHGRPEGRDVGSLATWRDTSLNCAAI